MLKFVLHVLVLVLEILSEKSSCIKVSAAGFRKTNIGPIFKVDAPKAIAPTPLKGVDFECGSLKRYTLFFLHFQKCGGKSVEKSLEKFARKCKYGYSRFPHDWKNKLPNGDLTFLTGHIFFGLHLNLPKNWDYDYVAVFRDPFDRSWSQFKHNGQRRCRCTFFKFSELFTNYYQFKLIGSRSNTNTNLKRAIRNLSKISVTGYLDDIDSWYENLQHLLQNRSISSLKLPTLMSFNIRNTSKVQGTTGDVGSTYNMQEYEAARNSKDFEQMKAMNRNDYMLLSELKD